MLCAVAPPAENSWMTFVLQIANRHDWDSYWEQDEIDDGHAHHDDHPHDDDQDKVDVHDGDDEWKTS